jgi:L-ribulose-5-phosphate 4-epimerase
MSGSEYELRQQMAAAARMLFRAGVMSHSGHGNMSVRLGDGERMLLTSGGSLADLAPEQLSTVTFDGEVVGGHLEPVTHEIVGMHTVVYRERPDARAVIHTHPPQVTSFALAHRPLPCAYEALLRFGVTVDIPVAPWGPRGSEASVRAIGETLRAHPDAPAVLLANHGLLALGASPVEAAMLVVAMEEAAEMTLGALPLGGAQAFPPGALEQVRTHIARFHNEN